MADSPIIGNLQIASSRTSSAVAPARNLITSLPFELLSAIVWDEQLTEEDLQALRLSCRTLAPAAASRLFSRIYVSKLVADRDAFLAICNTPHLAQHVREVEWLEISHTLGDFEHVATDVRIEECVDICRYFETASQSLFWLFNGPTCPRDDEVDVRAIDAARRVAIAIFRPVFESALDKLANLHTFVSRPMTSNRVLSDLEYPIEASQFQFLKEPPVFKDLSQSQTNDGLFLFLLPAMNRPTSTVTRLRWLDEFPGCGYWRQYPDWAFKNLKSLDMSIGRWMNDPLEPFDSGAGTLLDGLMKAFVSSIPTLRHFKLALDFPWSFGAWRDIHPGCIILRWLINGFALESLSLCSMGLETTLLLRLIEGNVASLRRLTLEDVPVFSLLIKNMAQIPGLQLASIQIQIHEELLYSEGTWYHDEFESDDGLLSAHEDSSSVGSCLPKNEWSYVRVTVTETALLRYLRGQPPICDMDHKLHDALLREETIITTESGSEADVAADSASDTSSENSRHYLRRTAPKWVWGRYFHKPEFSKEGRVFIYQLPGTSDGGYATVTWRFTSRYGEVTYGDDPLEWFEEWDPEAGDTEEPLPYCTALRDYVAMDLPAPDLGGSGPVAEALDSEGRVRIPPEGAFEYDMEDDCFAFM